MGGSRARWATERALSAGCCALALVQAHRTALSPALPARLDEQLDADLTLLQVATMAPIPPPPTLARARALAHESVSLLGRLRALLRHEAPAGHPVLECAGVGTRTSAARMSSVVAALTAMATAAELHPRIFERAGILPEDIDQCLCLHGELSAAAAEVDEQRRELARLQRERAALQRRVEDCVIEVSLAGTALFEQERETAQRFRALLPRRPRTRRPLHA